MPSSVVGFASRSPTTAGPARLRRRIHDVHAESGRGLRLVQTLASRWGVREDTRGRTIWFELDLGAASEQRRPPARRSVG
jgi:hypothetical protein